MERPKILDIPWDQLPLKFRQQWWQATDFNQHPPSPEFAAQMPSLLAVEQAASEEEKHKIAADCARTHEFLLACWRRQPPIVGRVDHLGRGCAECLRPASPCQMRCLRSLLHPDDRRA